MKQKGEYLYNVLKWKKELKKCLHNSEHKIESIEREVSSLKKKQNIITIDL